MPAELVDRVQSLLSTLVRSTVDSLTSEDADDRFADAIHEAQKVLAELESRKNN